MPAGHARHAFRLTEAEPEGEVGFPAEPHPGRAAPPYGGSSYSADAARAMSFAKWLTSV